MNDFFGIKVSGEDDSVLETPAEQLITSSEYAPPKIKVGESPPHVGHGEYKVPSSGSGSRVALSLNHGYPYTPSVFILISTGSDQFRPAPTLWFFPSPVIDAFCNATQLRIEISDITNVRNQTLKYRYYIFDRNGT